MVEVGAPPPLLTQMMMISVIEFDTSFPPLFLLSPLLESLLFSFPRDSADDSTDTPSALIPTAPRATKSACRVPANASGAAQSATTAENLMVIY
jgi:hypothetical protein